MRISDWSSDVCSSDLQRRKRVFLVASGGDDLDPAEVPFERAGLLGDSSAGRAPWQEAAHDAGPGAEAAGACAGLAGFAGLKQPYGKVTTRSEEHTSELQSLMRISYAVFCLKKTTQ